MKRLIFALGILFLFGCSKSSSTSSSGSGKITMKVPNGATFTSTNITRVLQSTTGVFYFNADPFDSYRKFYFFSGNFDVHNNLSLDITLNGTNSITLTGSNLLTSVTINDKWIKPVKEIVNLTSSVYPGRIAGDYTLYDNKNAVICSGTFDYTAK